MKILLIKPPQNPYLATNAIYEPLDLEYLASSLSDATVRILDMRIERNLHKELLDFKPDLAGITAYTCDYNTAVHILKEIRNFDKSILTVVGGHHATFMPGDFVLPWVDAVFLGYADSTFPRYVRSLGNPEKLREIPNIGLIENNKPWFTKRTFSAPDLDSLPLPDRSLILKYSGKYHDPFRDKLSLVMTSRGCPFRCNFCACWKLMDGKYAVRSPESIIEELKSLPEEAGAVYFSDDNTFADIGRMWRFSSLMKKNNIRKKLQMYARADTVVKNQPLFEELAGAGLQYLTIGFESFRDSDLAFYKKQTSVEMNTKAIHILKKLNIYIISHIIVRPEYSREDFSQLYGYVDDNNLFRTAYPVLTPLPGTELYNETKETFTITNFDYFDFAHSITPTRLDQRDFYRELTNLYMRSYSIIRLLKHRFNRLFSFNREKFYTDNTDGLTFTKLIRIYFYTIISWMRLRYTFSGFSRHPYHERKFRPIPA